MSNFDIDFGPWVSYGKDNKDDEIHYKMQQLTTQEWSPFNGHDMAKVFIFCMAYGFAKGREPVKPPGGGSMPASAFDVITNANEVVKICEGYAYAAFLEVYDRISSRDSSIPPETILETLIQEFQDTSK